MKKLLTVVIIFVTCVIALGQLPELKITERDLKGTPDEGLPLDYGFDIFLLAATHPNTDFDALMRDAPVLDVSASGFNEKKAREWHRNAALNFMASLVRVSERFESDFERIAGGIGADVESGDVTIVLSNLSDMLKKASTQKPHDVFVQKYFVQYLEAMSVLLGAMTYISEFTEQLGLNLDDQLQHPRDVDTFVVPTLLLERMDVAARREAVVTLRDYESKLNKLVFAPGLKPIDIIARRAGLRSAKRLASLIEATL